MGLFRPNRDLERELREQPEFNKGLTEAAEPAREHAETIAKGAGAPWMRRKGARDVVVLTEEDGEVRLVNTDYGGAITEWGGKDSPPHAPLRRGVRAAGHRLDER